MFNPKLVLSVLAFCIPAASLAQDAGIGKSLFNQYCATCHGVDGGGAGPLTEIMLEKPADLRIDKRDRRVVGLYHLLLLSLGHVGLMWAIG